MKVLTKFSSAIALIILSVACAADPPYDVSATFSAPIDGGTPSGYRLYQGCRNGETKTLVGEVTSGQTFTGLLTADGEYSFCVHAYNATGEGPSSSIAVVTINDFDPVPGVPTNFVISVTCDASCDVTITSQ